MPDAIETQRGVIHNRARRQQIADMSGLRYGKITPTDFDAFIEFDDRLFVFVEGKFAGAAVPYGQLLALRRLCAAVHKPPMRYAFGIVADHYAPVHQDIDFASMTVRTIWQRGKLQDPMQKGLTVRSAIDRMVAFVENNTGRPLYGRAQLVRAA